MIRATLIFILMALPVWALEPAEMLSDPALEARARGLDFEIRCVKCQSEAVASSNAAWAKDARAKIRQLVADGATDQEVKDWFQARYGDFVLMDPPKRGANLVLWAAGPGMLVVGAGIVVAWLHRRRRLPQEPEVLDAQDTARLLEILDK